MSGSSIENNRKLYRQAAQLDAKLQRLIYEKRLSGRRYANLLQMSSERINRRVAKLRPPFESKAAVDTFPPPAESAVVSK